MTKERACPSETIERLLKKIERLTERLQDCETGLETWDSGHESEYWLRHPTPFDEQPAAPLPSSGLYDSALEFARQVAVDVLGNNPSEKELRTVALNVCDTIRRAHEPEQGKDG
jgi:hypothetical protein